MNKDTKIADLTVEEFMKLMAACFSQEAHRKYSGSQQQSPYGVNSPQQAMPYLKSQG